MAKLQFTDALFLGDGNHKKVWIHPGDEHLCVKVVFREPDEDLEREFGYRRALGSRAEQMPLLTKYLGEADTSEGRGYIFERIIDYDGSSSSTLLSLLEHCAGEGTEKEKSRLLRILQDFHREFLAERFFAAGMDPDNFLVQRVSPTEDRVRIIDNIGTSARLPLEYYVDFLARKRAEKYWRIFMEELCRDYPELMTEAWQKALR